MLKCQVCGAENDPDAKFCTACGAELTAAPLFTNASQMGRAQQELLNRKVKLLSIVSIALGALLLICNLISEILIDESDMVFWILACLLIACGVSLLVTVCKMNRSQALKEPSTNRFAFYQNYFTVQTLRGGEEIGVVKIRYEELFRVKETKDYYLFYVNAQSVLMVEKNSFPEGERSFRNFIFAALPPKVNKLKK